MTLTGNLKQESYFRSYVYLPPTPSNALDDSQMRIVTCPCHAHEMLNQYPTVQAATLNDFITAFPHYSSTQSSLNELLSTLTSILILIFDRSVMRLFSALPLPPLSSPFMPCLPLSPSQVIALVLQKCYLWLLGNNLFVLVVAKEAMRLWRLYGNLWAWLTIIQLPLTLSLGLGRLLWGCTATMFWGFWKTVLDF